MSKNEYRYAPDEFDQPSSHDAPAGVHREQPSAWRKTWPFLLVIVLFSGLAVGGFVVWKNQGAPSVSTPQASAAPSAVASEVPEPDAGGTDEEEEPQPETTPTQPAPNSEINRSAQVRVLNDSGVAGLAGVGADTLKAAGYTTVEADNYAGEKLTASAVYYKTTEMQATALDVAAQLKIPAENVKLVEANRASVSVILVSDFRR